VARLTIHEKVSCSIHTVAAQSDIVQAPSTSNGQPWPEVVSSGVCGPQMSFQKCSSGATAAACTTARESGAGHAVHGEVSRELQAVVATGRAVRGEQ
jgi:hypothetical protein